MTARCQNCTAPSPAAFLCGRCVAELAAILTALAVGPHVTQGAGRTRSGGKWAIERRALGLLENLREVELKQTRMGNTGGHRKRGDEMPSLYEPDTENGRATKQGSATELLEAARNSLSTMARDLCEVRGIQAPRIALTADMALWLASHAHAIACAEGAGQCFAEIRALHRRIERVLDRPTPPRFIGPCPGSVPNEHAAREQRCNTMLLAKPGAIEVTCPNRRCRSTHNVERVEMRLLSEIDYLRFTKAELQQALNWLHQSGLCDEVPPSTLHSWIKDGKLKPAGYKRPDGRFGLSRRSEEDKPVYRLADARRLRSEQVRRKARAS